AQWFALDSTLIAAAYRLKPQWTDSLGSWSTRRIDNNRVELIREPVKEKPATSPRDRVILLDDKWIRHGAAEVAETGPYGVNRLTRSNILQLGNDRVRFFLPGNKGARRVYLSGSFNGWSTMQTPMAFTDSGWAVTIKLRPGKYTYKYIVDGRWVNDPFNKLKESDTYRGFNNVFYCYNYTFRLAGYSDAKKVAVAGSFNNWKPDELRLIRFHGVWQLPLYLRDGTHAYKFIVDNRWTLDPACKVTRSDGRGNENSFLGIGDTLFFSLKGHTDATKVVLSGNFNGWNHEELTMTKTRAGWVLPYVLAPGNYEYKFIVDGKWIADPENPYTAGSGNGANSLLIVDPTYWFRLDQYTDADKVFVAGSFNNWNRSIYRMELRQGTWWFPLYLKPGKYTYKFVVDGKWILDPANHLWEENDYGTGNSVLWIEP
ncbi:MAG TPA: glycogen-binding domain-containing protein, partial [Bacteroidales bacterium]|nr:glycogen-binding domain-containing protein [Bacteroidales bacterium]